MRKPLKSLVAATGAAIVMTAGFAAPALAAPASPAGTSPNVTVDRTQTYVADMTYTLPSGNDTRLAPAWSCGLFRVDGWGGATGGWRVAVGASYAMPAGFTFSLPTAGNGWEIVADASGSFYKHGTSGSSVSRMNTDPTFEDYDRTSGYPQYHYLADLTERPTVEERDGQVVVTVPALAAGEYFNIEFSTAAVAPTGDAEAPTTRSVAATAFATCETPDTTSPSPEPSEPVRPAPDKHIKKVNSGGVEEGGSGLIALGLGAVALGGLAVYGRRRSNR